MDSIEKLMFVYKGGRTKRFHTADILTTQNVAEHSFGVAALVHILDPAARKEVLLAALSYDLAEHLVGIIPSPVKRQFPAVKVEMDIAENTLLANSGFNYEQYLTPEERNILNFQSLHNRFSPLELDSVLEWLDDNGCLSKRGVGFKNQFWKFLIKSE